MIDQPVLAGLDHLSHSALNDLEQCGELFRLARVVGVPKRPLWASIGGSAFHTATEMADMADFGGPAPMDFNDILDQMIPDIESSSGWPKSAWLVTGRRNTRTPAGEDEAFWRVNGPAWVKLWSQWRSRSSWHIWICPDGRPAVEVEISIDIDGIRIVGYIDRIMIDERNSLGVLDLKSGARDPFSAKQLGLYAKGVGARFGAEFTPEWGTYYMARSARLSIPADLTYYNDGRFDYEFNNAARIIRDGLYLPSRSGLCRTCSVNRYCYDWGGEESSGMRPYV